VPFYRKLASKLGLSAKDIRDEKDLSKLPMLSRSEVQDHHHDFYSMAGNRRSWYISRTSGSTGQPLVSYFDPTCWAISKYGLKMRRVLVTGVIPPAKIIQIETYSGRELDELARKQKTLLEGIFYKRKYLSVFQDPRKHLDIINRFKPHFIYGFPSYFKALAEELERGSGLSFNPPEATLNKCSIQEYWMFTVARNSKKLLGSVVWPMAIISILKM
jgi:phenylacetate-CoA ligase